MHYKLTKNHSLIIAVLATAFWMFGLAVGARAQQTPPAATPPGVSLEQRVAQRKAERNVAIDEKTNQRLLNACVSGQARLRTLQQKNAPVITNRIKAYQQMDAKLWVTIGKLKLAGKDTFNLEKQRATLADKANVFQQTTAAYQQSLDDAVVLNCKADLAGFKAMLETSRIYRGQIRDQSSEIRNYLINDIKSSLSGFAADLQVKPSTEEGN